MREEVTGRGLIHDRLVVEKREHVTMGDIVWYLEYLKNAIDNIILHADKDINIGLATAAVRKNINYQMLGWDNVGSDNVFSLIEFNENDIPKHKQGLDLFIQSCLTGDHLAKLNISLLDLMDLPYDLCYLILKHKIPLRGDISDDIS